VDLICDTNVWIGTDLERNPVNRKADWLAGCIDKLSVVSNENGIQDK